VDTSGGIQLAARPTLEAGFVAPFIDVAIATLERESGIAFQRGGLKVARVTRTTREVTVMFGIGGGRLNGLVVYGMSRATAIEIAGRMVGEPFAELDDLAQSAIGELGNMITGRAAMHLAEAGYPSRCTPPALVLGAGCTTSTLDVLRLVVPLESSIGTIELQVGLSARD
jgi:chemotaxis protein CheX